VNGYSLVQRLTAEALRAVIRAVGYVRETPANCGSLPRALLTANAADGLGRELERLAGYADLLSPVSTHADSQDRHGRLDQLSAALPEWPPLRQCLSGGSILPSELMGAELRGALVTADELQLRAVEEKLSRRGESSAAGQRQQLLELLHAEAAAWRGLDNSRLANVLIADRGFLDTYVSGRKRARDCMKSQLSPVALEQALDQQGDSVRTPKLEKLSKKVGLKLSQLRELARWQRSVLVQLDLLAGMSELSLELAGVRSQQRHALKALDVSLRLARLAKALPGDRGLAAARLQCDTELLGALQAAFSMGKANYRALVESQLG